jgi:hypothetical protein
MRTLKLTPLLIFPLFFGCQKDDGDRTAELNFSRPGAIGGSIMAGYQDGALYAKGQNLSIPALIFQQLVEYGGETLSVPALTEQEGIGLNFKPWESLFQTKSVLGYRVDCNNDESLGPIKQLLTGSSFSDFSNQVSSSRGYQCVPFMSTQDAFDPNFGLSLSDGNSNPYYHRFAADPGVSTPVGELVNYAPTFTTVWLGMDDIFNYAIHGGVGYTIPSVQVFRSNLEQILSDLSANGSKGVIANIPSIDHFPFFNLIPYNGANLEQEQVDELNGLYSSPNLAHINFVEGANGFITYDQNSPNGIRHMVEGERMLLTVPLDSMRCYLYGLLLAYVNDRYTLTLSELSNIQAAINGYNEVIEELAIQYDFAHFDANAFFAKLNTGVKWNGADVNLNFVSGGFFSLDGLHPHQKGNVLLANGMIESINKKYGSRIPTINCSDCDGVIFP